MRRAFIVTGPEATGTKLVTQILLAAGCHGDPGNHQWILRALKDSLGVESDPIVLRVSMPHGLEWLDIGDIIWHLKCLAYTPRVIVTARDWFATGASQIHEQTHAFSPEHSQRKRERAYKDIFAALLLTALPYCVVTYESLVLHYEAVASRLIAWCGLEPQDPLPEIYDGNEKWYA